MKSINNYLTEKLHVVKGMHSEVVPEQVVFTDKESIYKTVIKMLGNVGESVGKNPRFRNSLKYDIEEWIEKSKYIKHFKYTFGGDINIVPEKMRSLINDVEPSFKKLSDSSYKFGELYTRGTCGSSVGKDRIEFYTIVGYKPRFPDDPYSLYIELKYKKDKWDDIASKCALLIRTVSEKDLQ